VRERGRDAFEDWRVTICRMAEPQKWVAVTYVTNFTRDIKHKYIKTCLDADVAPWPFDESNDDHRYAMFVAFDYGIEQMHSEGTYIPTDMEAAPLIKLKELANQMGPSAYAAGKTTFDKVKADAKVTYQHLKDNGPKYAKVGWEQTKKTAAAHADWMEQQAAKSEERRIKRSFTKRTFLGKTFKTPTIEGIYRKIMPF
jgi:hypothetical protein